MLNKKRASAKLYLLVLVMSIFIIGIGIYGIHELKIMNRNTQTLYADRVLPMEEVTIVRYSYLVGIISAAEQTQANNFSFAEANKQIDEANKKIADNWKAYMLTYLTPEEKQLAEHAALLMNQADKTIAKLKAILSKEDKQALENIVKNELYPAILPVINNMNELIELQVRVGGEVYKNSNEVYNAALKKFFVVIVLCLLFAIPFSYYLVGSVKNLIEGLNESNIKTIESENRYRNIFENIQDVFYQTTLEGTILDTSPSIKTHTGFSREEVIGTQVKDLYYEPSDREKVITLLREKGELVDYEFRLKTNTGIPIYVSLNARLIYNADRSASHIDGIFRNITERKKVTELFKRQFENSPDIILIINKNLTIESINRGVNKDSVVEDLIGINCLSTLPEESKEAANNAIIRCFETGQNQELEGKLRSDRWASSRFVPITYNDGTITHIMIISTEITERKRSEEKLKQNEARLKEAQAIGHMGNWEVDIVNKIHTWSEEFYKISGLDENEVQPSTEAFLSFIHPDDIAKVQAGIRETFTSFLGSNDNFRFLKKDGSVQYAYTEWKFEFDKNNQPVRLYGIIQDITERKKAEESIKQSEANYRQIFDLSPAPMWLFDENTYKFIQVNKACVNHYGYSEEEFANMTIDDISAPDDEKDTAWKNNTPESNYIGSNRHVKKSGEVMDVLTSSIPVILNGKKQVLFVAIDVTEKNLYEKKLARAAIKAQEDERYEIGGELHDNVCQILATSMLTLGMIAEKIPQESKEYFQMSHGYINLACKEIRNLSHRLAPAFIDDATLEDEFTELLRNFNVEGKYTTTLNFDESAKKQLLSRELQLNLYRILQEQLRNILKHANASNIDITVTIKNNALQMCINDNGKGFNVKNNKDGIGLANMKRRVQLFLGSLIIDSALGKGCKVFIEIPLQNTN